MWGSLRASEEFGRLGLPRRSPSLLDGAYIHQVECKVDEQPRVDKTAYHSPYIESWTTEWNIINGRSSTSRITPIITEFPYSWHSPS